MPKHNDETTKTYFWMIHYDFSPPAGDLQPVAAGRKRAIYVFARNIYADQTLDFRMPRENEGGVDDPMNYRGNPNLRNRILGFYTTQEEANAHIDSVWAVIQEKCGAVYAELHSLRVDVAEDLRLAA
jgi:hypothetical protein